MKFKQGLIFSLLFMIAGASGAAVQSACATPASVAGRSTSNLTATGVSALHKKEAVKALDTIRDTAIDGEAMHLIPTATARLVVQWHKSTLEVLKASDSGWQAATLTGLEQLRADIPAADKTKFTPYIDAAKVIFQAVIQ